MTIPSTARKAGPFIGTGVQTAWPFTFKVFADSDVLVTSATALGVETELVLDTDYSVALNGNQETSPGGTVTYPISGTPLPVGSVLVIVGDLAYDQPLDLPAGGNFSPSALENELDRLTMQLQQLKEQIGRALQVSVTTDASIALPAPASNNIIGWDSTGEALQNFPMSEISTAIAFATYRYDTFTGDGTTTVFTLDADPVTLGNIDVSIDGLTSVPGVDHTLLNTNLIFTVAPSLGTEILARYGQGLGSGMSGDALDISYQPAGVGAVATTVQAYLDNPAGTRARSNPSSVPAGTATMKIGLCGPGNPSWLGNPAANDYVALYTLATSEEGRNLIWAMNPIVNIETGQPAAAWGMEVDVNVGTANTVDPHTGLHAIGVECVSGAQFAPSAAFSSYSTTLANRWKTGIWLDSIGGQTGSALIKSYVNCNPDYGLDFSNSAFQKQAIRIGATPENQVAGIAVKQHANGNVGLSLHRNTDSLASGNLIHCVNAANNTVLYSVDVFGQTSAAKSTAGSFVTLSGTQAMAAGVTASLFSLSAEGTYLVSVYVVGGGSANSSVAMVINDGTSLILASVKAGANTVLSVSGTSLQDTQAGTTSVKWSYIKIA